MLQKAHVSVKLCAQEHARLRHMSLLLDAVLCAWSCRRVQSIFQELQRCRRLLSPALKTSTWGGVGMEEETKERI